MLEDSDPPARHGRASTKSRRGRACQPSGIGKRWILQRWRATPWKLARLRHNLNQKRFVFGSGPQGSCGYGQSEELRTRSSPSRHAIKYPEKTRTSSWMVRTPDYRTASFFEVSRPWFSRTSLEATEAYFPIASIAFRTPRPARWKGTGWGFSSPFRRAPYGAMPLQKARAKDGQHLYNSPAAGVSRMSRILVVRR